MILKGEKRSKIVITRKLRSILTQFIVSLYKFKRSRLIDLNTCINLSSALKNVYIPVPLSRLFSINKFRDHIKTWSIEHVKLSLIVIVIELIFTF